MERSQTKDTRTYAAASILVLLIVFLMLFLVFVEIPSGNKDLVVSIISMLLGGGGVALAKLFGDTDSELEELKIKFLELKVQHETLQREHDKLTAMLIERHVIHGQGITIDKRDK